MVSLLDKYGGMAVGKAFMKYVGLDSGACRLPVTNMQEGRYAAFVEDVKSLGIDKLFSKL